MSLLTIITTVCAELSLVQPTAIIGSADRQVQQLYALANLASEDLAKSYPWQAIRKVQTFTTTAAETQAGAVPSDLDHFIPNTFFNRTSRREMVGPLTAREYEAIKAQPVYASVYLAFIERQKAFLIQPVPAAGQTIAYEYMSVNRCTGAGGDAPTFVADADTSLLDEGLIRRSLKWRYLRAKGLDYAQEFDDYERELEKAQARDGGSTMISIAPQPVDMYRMNIPDGSFGV